MADEKTPLLVGRVLAQLPPDTRRQFVHHVTTGAVHAELAERCLTPRGRGTETLGELRDYLRVAARELEAALALLPASEKT
ncbi:MAG TPA: hypothetical protein VK066_03815 [Chloroflexota bacterium]|nr:hypothetical protein [Chloroflexota bacterium]